MKEQTLLKLTTAIQTLIDQQILSPDCAQDLQLVRTKNPEHGDFSSNAAMVCAKSAGMSPRSLAEKLVELLKNDALFTSVEIAGPGFINFRIQAQTQFNILHQILEQGETFGCNQDGAGQKLQIEYVSANPTGPLHVGHGRGAAYGATLANIYRANGYSVHQEYYVNDAGRQMDILATSVWLRYLELSGQEFRFPDNGYRGDYVWDIAADVHRHHQDRFQCSDPQVFSALPPDESQGGDKEKHIDALIGLAKSLLGTEQYSIVFDCALDTILGDIKDDLSLFGVHFDCWFSERQLVDSGKVTEAIDRLKSQNCVYEKDGALWFRSSDFGDEKDRVLVRDNGQATYFASDVAYHMNKFERGFSKVVNIWGADHHGYIARVKAALTALGKPADQLEILLVQFAILYRGTERLQMSTRSGEFVTLRWLRKEVGNDAARFYYVMRRCDQHLDFDLELAVSTSNDNPVYYVQYSHARICAILNKLNEAGFATQPLNDVIDSLDTETEGLLAQHLAEYPDVIRLACERQSPHIIVTYARELAQKFHSYYNLHQVLVEDSAVRSARSQFIQAIRQVLVNALTLLGVSAPERM